jgi:CubicO group peptidase (beta-lactamase class C family)
LQPFVDRHALAGAVTLVADANQRLDVEAVGYSNLAANQAMKPDAIFWIASQTKPITATALMILVDEGKVSLDDPAEDYLPDLKGLWVETERDDDHLLLRRPKRAPTVRDLLSHVSGMPFASGMEKPTLDGLSLADCVKSYAMTPLQTDPGERYQYSNAGINSAGRIIEVASGMAYEDFLSARLFDPLGMKDTTFFPDQTQVARIAKSYKPDASGNDLEETTIPQLTYPLDGPNRHPMPAGGLFSTAYDLERFCRMILNGGILDEKRYLSEDSVKEMSRKQTGEAIPESYGLGWGVDDEGFGHGGAYSTNMRIDTKRGLIFVFLVQHAGFPGNGGESHSAFVNAAIQAFGEAGG